MTSFLGDTASNLGTSFPASPCRQDKDNRTKPEITKLPREGAAKGGGKLRIVDREIFEGPVTEACETPLAEPPAGLGSKRRPSEAHPSGGSSKGKSGDTKGNRSAHSQDGASPRSSTTFATKDKKGGDNVRLSPQERRRREIAAKWEKTEALRLKDRKDILERLEKHHDMREARYKRLIESVTGEDNLAYKTALALRERDTHEERRKRELYGAWDEKVFQPMATQLYDHLNMPNRAVQQMLSGSKSVCFQEPGDKFVLVANVHEDPARKPVVDTARENTFHRNAHAVLQRALGTSRSAPDLRGGCPAVPGIPGVFGRPAGGEPVVPRAMSRPVLEPENWGQVKLQGTLFGHFAQVAEQGADFHPAKRGGSGVHIPDTSDGVPIAGTRVCRTNGHHDLGILRGSIGKCGVSSTHKNLVGASHGAPSQDHYTYEIGLDVTNREFPLGKRCFPEYA